MLSATNQPGPLVPSGTPDGPPSAESGIPPVTPHPTPLAAAEIQSRNADCEQLALHCGALTLRTWDGLPEELEALLHTAGVSDLGWRGKLRVTGGDRLRWLNGMVSNTVQALPAGEGNYSFLLSAQGRVQGDCHVYRRDDDLLLDTGVDQIPTLLKHLDHYIIMDDVELADVSQQWTALSLAGPSAAQVLDALGITLPQAPSKTSIQNARLRSVQIGEAPCVLVEAPPVLVPRFEVWFAPEQVSAVWETLQAAGAHPCGLAAAEALRVLEAVPLYGLDLHDRDLPQETAQAQALNFSKGCYLGQEIVERIRSRGKVNRQFRQFSLKGAQPVALPADLHSDGQAVGRITSTATLPGAGLLALGFIRLEVAERHAQITYEGGSATLLAQPPAVTQPAFQK